jgi:hypothetical protein
LRDSEKRNWRERRKWQESGEICIMMTFPTLHSPTNIITVIKWRDMGGALGGGGGVRWEKQDTFQSDKLNGRALSTDLEADGG